MRTAMEIDIKDVTNGSMDGQTVYVCDYRQPDHNKKPIRNVPPTKVKILPNSEAKKTVYYSNSFFKPYGKNGNLTAKEIKPYDNTGFRMYTGEPLYVFDTYKEAVEKWNELLERHIEYWESEQTVIVQRIENKIVDFKNMLM